MPLSPSTPRISALIHLLCLLFLSTLHAQTPTWVLKSPQTRPEPRQLHTLTYDSARRHIVMVGATHFHAPLSGPIWIWDGSNWSKPELSGLPAPWFFHAAAFDEARGETVIFGGSTIAGLTSQTLVWDGTTLTQRNPPVSPSPRNASAMAYDAERKQIVLFGGGNTLGQLFDTWVWDGFHWQLKSPVHSPPARMNHAMTWDPVRKVVLLHGGWIAGSNQLANDIWAWNGSDWTQYAPAVSPPPRAWHSMAYIPTLDSTVVFGGRSTFGSTPLGDMWGWDGANWQPFTSPRNPVSRHSASMAYDASRRELVLFGGVDSYKLLNDTWIYSDTPAVQGFFNLSPTSLELSALTWETPPAIPPITVTAPYPSPFSVSTTTTDGTSWLRASPPSSTTPATVQVSIDTSSLGPGSHQGSVVISTPNPGIPPQSVPVSLTLDRPSFTISPASSFINVARGSQITAPQTLDLAASVEGHPAFIVQSFAPWLSVSPSSGVSPARLTLAVNAAGLAEGSYATSIGVYESTRDKLTPAFHHVYLKVQSHPTLIASPSSINLSAKRASDPRTATIQVSTNLAPASISASVATTNGRPWLSISPIAAAAGQPARFTVTLNPSGLSVGIHNGSITFSSPNIAAAPVTVPVSLSVVPDELILPQIAEGAGWRTTISLINLESTPAPFVLRFFSPTGDPLALPLEGRTEPYHSFESTIPARGLVTIRTRGSAPALAQGWAELESPHNIQGVGVFRRRLPGQADLDAAVLLTAPAGRGFLLFDNQTNRTTSLALVNPTPSPSNITASIVGSFPSSNTIHLPPKGQQTGETPVLVPATRYNHAMLLLNSDSAPFAGLGLLFDPSGPFSSIPLLTDLNSSSGDQAMPQIADGGQDSVWKTTLTVFNLSPYPTVCRVFFVGPDGLPLFLSQEGSDILFSSAGSNMVGEGFIQIRTRGLPGPLRQGWARLTSSDPNARLVAIAVFRQITGGVTKNEAAVVGVAPGRHFVIPFDNTDGAATSLALANIAEGSAAQVTLTARDENGIVIGTAALDLPASGQSAFRLLDRLPVTAGRRGTIELESPADISCMGLQFNPSGTFTSVPAIARSPGL